MSHTLLIIISISLLILLSILIKTTVLNYYKIIKYQIFVYNHAPILKNINDFDDFDNTATIPINQDIHLYVHNKLHQINIDMILNGQIIDTAIIRTINDTTFFKRPYNQVIDPIINRYYQSYKQHEKQIKKENQINKKRIKNNNKRLFKNYLKQQ